MAECSCARPNGGVQSFGRSLGGSIPQRGGRHKAPTRGGKWPAPRPLSYRSRRGIVAAPSAKPCRRSRAKSDECASNRVSPPMPKCSRRLPKMPAAAPPAKAARRAQASSRCIGLIPFVMRYRGRVVAALVALARRGAGDARGADRGAPHDRQRLRRRARRPDRRIFRRHDRGGGGARGGERACATTSSPASASASSPTCATRCSTASPSCRPSFFDTAKIRRAGVAAHRRHHPDQGRGRRLGLDRAAQPRAVLRLRRHDGGDERAALRLRARRHPGDRAAAGRVRPHGAPALARRAGHPRRCLRLCLRADRRGAHAAGLHQRAAGADALSRRGRARLRGGAALRSARAPC